MAMKVILALFCLAFTTVSCQSVCGTVGPIWRNDNRTCLSNAVCGDVFRIRRDWRDGRVCNETRILSNCLCPGNRVCPFHNEAYAMSASARHIQYTCETTCTFPWCQNVHLAPPERGGRDRPRLRHDDVVVSMTSEQRAPAFGGKTYYKMSCRCPQHFQVAPRHQRAVRAFNYRYNWNTHTYSTLYICNNRWGTNAMADPCA